MVQVPVLCKLGKLGGPAKKLFRKPKMANILFQNLTKQNYTVLNFVLEHTIESFKQNCSKDLIAVVLISIVLKFSPGADFVFGNLDLKTIEFLHNSN